MIRDIELVTLLQTLIAAGQGSFHKAGTSIGVPASTVSRRVKSLETLIGIKLFDRHRHGIRPTAAGGAFLEQIGRILDELNIALLNASTKAQGQTGWLKIGAYVSPSTGQLRAALREYRHRFPDVDVQYTDGERRHLIERLDAGAIDVAIVAGQFRAGVRDVIPLWREKVLVAVPEFSFARQKGERDVGRSSQGKDTVRSGPRSRAERSSDLETQRLRGDALDHPLQRQP